MSFEHAGFYGTDNFVGAAGVPLRAGTAVSGFDAGTDQLATLYTDRDRTAGPNPFTLGRLGDCLFYAEPGDYDLAFGAGPRIRVVAHPDPRDLTDLDSGPGVTGDAAPLNQYDLPFPAYGHDPGATRSFPTWYDDGPNIGDGWEGQDPNSLLAVPFDGIAPVVPLHLVANGFTAATVGSLLANSDIDPTSILAIVPAWSRWTDGIWPFTNCGAFRARFVNQDGDDPYPWTVLSTLHDVPGFLTPTGQIRLGTLVDDEWGDDGDDHNITPPEGWVIPDGATSVIVDFGIQPWAFAGPMPDGIAMRGMARSVADSTTLDATEGTVVLGADITVTLPPEGNVANGRIFTILGGDAGGLLALNEGTFTDPNGAAASSWPIEAHTVTSAVLIDGGWHVSRSSPTSTVRQVDYIGVIHAQITSGPDGGSDGADTIHTIDPDAGVSDPWTSAPNEPATTGTPTEIDETGPFNRALTLVPDFGDGDVVQTIVVRYHTAGSAAATQVTALAVLANQAALPGTGANSQASFDFDNGHAMAAYTGWVNPASDMLTLTLDPPVVIDADHDVHVQIRARNPDVADTVTIDDVTWFGPPAAVDLAVREGTFAGYAVSLLPDSSIADPATGRLHHVVEGALLTEDQAVDGTFVSTGVIDTSPPGTANGIVAALRADAAGARLQRHGDPLLVEIPSLPIFPSMAQGAVLRSAGVDLGSLIATKAQVSDDLDLDLTMVQVRLDGTDRQAVLAFIPIDFGDDGPVYTATLTSVDGLVDLLTGDAVPLPLLVKGLDGVAGFAVTASDLTAALVSPLTRLDDAGAAISGLQDELAAAAPLRVLPVNADGGGDARESGVMHIDGSSLLDYWDIDTDNQPVVTFANPGEGFRLEGFVTVVNAHDAVRPAFTWPGYATVGRVPFNADVESCTFTYIVIGAGDPEVDDPASVLVAGLANPTIN